MIGFLFACAAIGGILMRLPEAAERFLSALVLLYMAGKIIRLVSVVKKTSPGCEGGEENGKTSPEETSLSLVLSLEILACAMWIRLLTDLLTPFRWFLTEASLLFSKWTGILINRPIAMGITYSGIEVVILFLLAFFRKRACSRERSGKQRVNDILLVLGIWCTYMGLWTVLAENSLRWKLHTLEPLTGPLDYRLLLFGMLALAYHFRFRKSKDRESSRRAFVFPILVVLLCLVVRAIPIHSPVASASGHIVFWDTGIDFQLPEKGTYGLDRVGMFGGIPRYLRRRGYDCRIEQDLSEVALDGAAAVVLFNPMRSPTAEEKRRVLDFVRDGGNVLAVGDHTGMEQVRFPINAVIEPTGMALEFDSAVPFKSLWGGRYQRWKNSIFADLNDGEVQAVVGASLRTGPRSKPLLTATEGYSDPGDADNVGDGYLGNMKFNRGERIGDLVLAAEERYGSGRFVVFGDTTPFQNTVLAYSHPMIDRLFAGLAGEPGKRSDEPDSKKTREFESVCVINASHLESFARDKSSNAVDGLIACAWRSGMMPYLNLSEETDRFLKSHPEASLLIFIEPALSFREREWRAIEDFLRNGGSVALFGGYDSPKATSEIAARFGFSFVNMPIGRISPAEAPEMAFWNACPLEYEGAEVRDGDGVRSRMEIWGHTVIAEKEVGKGRLYVFSDPDFLKNKNIEHIDSYREGNVRFLEQWLEEVKKK